MKVLLPGLLLALSVVTACGSPAQVTLFPGARGSQETSRGYHAPNVIQTPTIASDTPSATLYFPDDPASVMQRLTHWLDAAVAVNVAIPKDPSVTFYANIDPSTLAFLNQDGHRVTVMPTFYLVGVPITADKTWTQYKKKFIANTVTYQDGSHVLYLKSPELFQWLVSDQWKSEFRPMSYTTADEAAIHAVSKRGYDIRMYPPSPGIQRYTMIVGGPYVPGQQNRTMPGTVETLVDPSGVNRKVTFIEVWANGSGEHRWTFLVSPTGAILQQSQVGDIPPQDWQ